MRLLILVLSYTEYPFNHFMLTQNATWDSTKHSDIDVIYYHGGKRILPNKELVVGCTDAYEMMHWKFKLALDAIDYNKYDLIFRTNSCSYIVKSRILEVAKQLPLQSCYAGWQNGTYISGAGVFFSPDVLDILKAELTPIPHGAEDVLIGQMLAGRVRMIDDKSRTDADYDGFHSYEGYHFRAKTSNDNGNDRMRDVGSLLRLHEYFK